MGLPAVEQVPDIPTTCVGAVVKNEGPDFYIEVEDLPVPEISVLPNLRGPDPGY